MNGASRIKKGFWRLSLLLGVPLLVAALGLTVYEAFNPSGHLIASNVIEGGNNRFAAYAVRRFDNSDIENADKLLFGIEGFDYMLLDGRVVRIVTRKHNNSEDLSDLNRMIISFEIKEQKALGNYDRFVSKGILFGCAKSGDCDFPFPNKGQSHLKRTMNWEPSFVLAALATIWFCVVHALSWLIRGFMKD